MPETLVPLKSDADRKNVIDQLDADLGRVLLTADQHDQPCYLRDLLKVDQLRAVDRIGLHLAHGLIAKSLDDEGEEMADAYDLTNTGHKFFTAAAKRKPPTERVTVAAPEQSPARRPRGGAVRKAEERTANVPPPAQSRRDRNRRPVAGAKGPRRRR